MKRTSAKEKGLKFSIIGTKSKFRIVRLLPQIEQVEAVMMTRAI